MTEQPRTVYHAFVDGSAYESRKQYGIGGIIFKAGELNACHAFNKHLDGKHSSFTAELYAAVEALKAIPPNSVVVIHSDLDILCKKIRKDKLKEWPEKQRKPKDTIACHELFNAASLHKKVYSRHICSEDSDLIATAHHLARAGARNEMLSFNGFTLTKKGMEALERLETSKPFRKGKKSRRQDDEAPTPAN